MIPSGLDVPTGSVLVANRGSVAHGMYVPKNDPSHIDDIDVVGIVIAPIEHYIGLTEWGSRGTKEQWQGQYDCVWYEIKKAITLLLQGNPNILSLLWLEPVHYLMIGQAGSLLLTNRRLFVGKHVYDSFAGYASAQLLKMESRNPSDVREYIGITYELKRRGVHPTDQNLPEDWRFHDFTDCSDWSTEKLHQRLKHYQKKGENLGYLGDKRKQLVLEHGYDAKNAAHCIRLLRMAKEFLSTGDMQVYRRTDRDELLDIKAGKWKLEDIKNLAEQLFAEVKQAKDSSFLPPKPDRKAVETLLVNILKESLRDDH